MLELMRVTKIYNMGNDDIYALNDVHLSFEKAEFVSILGPSGCGKTTLLNVLGGLTNFQTGDLLIHRKTTKDYTDEAWDAYRNHHVGFVFQSYNLIDHISVLANVELALSLSGMRKKERKKAAKDVLIKVGLAGKLHHKPNQLSNGQVQRVAIARAIVTNPSIILADEPTGALDSETSTEIVKLLKELSKDKLVIMVTHNDHLAHEYSDRIIKLLDGRVIDEAIINHSNTRLESSRHSTKTYMNYATALKLSFSNLIKKIGKTIISSIAGGIGIVGIGLVIAISIGFSKYVEIVQLTTNTNTPVVIENKTVIESFPDPDNPEFPVPPRFPSNQLYVTPQQTSPPRIYEEVVNEITPEYMTYLNNLETDLYHEIKYYYDMTYPTFLRKDENDKIHSVNYSHSNSADIGEIPYDDPSYISQMYDVLYGRLPNNEMTTDRIIEGILIISDRNQLPDNMLNRLGFDGYNYGGQIHFDDLLNLDIKIAHSNIIYEEDPNTELYKRKDNAAIYEDEQIITLKIVGIMRRKQNAVIPQYQGIRYTSVVNKMLLNETKSSNIVLKQQQIIDNHLVGSTPLYSILTGQTITLDDAYKLLRTLGIDQVPSRVLIYHKDAASKELIKDYLDDFNLDKTHQDYILMNPEQELDTRLVDSTLSSINIVLILVGAIAVFISVSLLSILSYISVIQRTTEIGILRSIGARKKDIFRVFSSEFFIIGLLSGLLGIGLLYVLLPVFNNVFSAVLRTENIIILDYLLVIGLLFGNLLLTFMIGFIPARMASNKDPIDAMKSSL